MSVNGVTNSYNYYNYLNPSSTAAASSSGLSKKDEINQLVKNYTYSSKGAFQAKLDDNDDSVWEKSELQSFADALKSATGRSINVDELIKKYGDEDGKIDSKAQKQMMSDNALQLAGLKSDWITANTAVESSTAKDSSSAGAGSFSINDLLGSMSGSGKASFSLLVQRAESQQNLLNGFSASVGSGGDMLNLLGSQSNLMMYSTALRAGNQNSAFFSSMVGQMMNSLG